MEFNEKIQELRKQRGMTQEELADKLFISRAAISKWESGRGYPNIDSLKAIANFFGVTVDELLSGDELLTIAEEDTKRKQWRLRDLVFGLLDCSAAMLFFLPLFRQTSGGVIQEASLLALTGVAPYLKVAYLIIVIGVIASGIATLALQGCDKARQAKTMISIALTAAGTLLFIISSQPYAAALMFVFLVIKALMLIKWQ